jgi:hypothetical protein
MRGTASPIDPTIKYYTAPSGDITAVVQLTGGAAQYLLALQYLIFTWP